MANESIKSAFQRFWGHTVSKIDSKVDKEDGKGLSANDFTDEYKASLDNIANFADGKVDQTDFDEAIDTLTDAVNNKANATHNHAISDVTNLQAQLDSKAEVGHKHNADYDAKGSADTALSSANTYTDESVEALGEGFSDVIIQMYGNDISDEGAPTIRQIAYDESNKVQANLDAHKNNKSNPHGVTASQVGADPAGSASAVQANVDALSSSVSSHTSNNNIHITADEKSKLNTLDTNLGVVEDKVDDHIANSNVHFTSAERTKLSNLENYSHPNSGVTAGTYRSVTVNAQGHVTGGTNPTTLAGYGITDAEAKGTVNTHNISDSSHADIRSLINELSTKLNNFLDVDDKTKDQLSELISLIEANKTDIESITSGKVNVSDIVNNLTTNLSDKPLSAAQGVELKILIDGLQAVVNAHETNTVNPHGVTASQIGLGNVDNTSDENKPVSTAQAKAIAEAKEVSMEAKVNLESHTADKSNPHGITKAQINLGNVDNTSDEDKPVSTLQATAIADAKKAGTDAQASLTTHTSNKANPHGVTKEQIDLGNVPNVTTNNQTPTYTVASANAELKSGETMSTAFGKIAKAISSLISHLGSKSNPHSVTKSQVGLGNVDNTADANKSVKHATTSDTASTATTLTGLTATVAELNKLDGVTATATELNYTDGVTSNIQTQLDGKQTTISGAATTITGSNLTASRALISNSSGKVAVSAVTSTELGYLNGVTSSIQTQLDGKQATVTGGASTITGNNLTASRALVSDGNGKVAVSAVTSTELGYLDGVTSNVQTQINNKLNKLSYEWVKEYNAGGTAGYLLIGSFPMYDSNLTINIDSTTSTTYHGTLVIATQNVSETSIGSSYTITVYDDPTGNISDAIRVVKNSGSRNYNVYFVPSTWSKTLIHVRAIGNYLNDFDESKMCTFTSGTAPTTTSGLTVVNALKTNFSGTGHTHNYAGSSSAGGSATSAEKLATARTISLTGDVTGSGSFDGSANLSITATVADDSHNHVISNVDGLQDTLDDFATEVAAVKKSVSDGKILVANAITEKGVTTATDATFATMAGNIANIKTGVDTSDANVTSDKMLVGYSGYANGVKVNGSITSQGAQTITPSTSNKTIAAGKYLSGVQTIEGDANLVASNIVSGKSIFGVAGSATPVTFDNSYVGSLYKKDSPTTRLNVTKYGEIEGDIIGGTPSTTWTYSEHTDQARGVAVDSSGNVYTCGADNTVHKINSSGAKVWTFTGHTDKVNGITLDSSGYVYTASSDQTVKKINPSNGTQVWSHMHGNTVRSVVTYGSYVFIGAGSTGGLYNFRQINTSNGASAMNKLFGNEGNQLQKLTIDSSGNIYMGDHEKTVRKVDGSGNILTTITVGGTTYGLEVDSSGNIIVATHEDKVVKYNPSGAKVWTFIPDNSVTACYGVALDTLGYIYVGDYKGKLYKLDSNGTRIWAISPHSNNLWDIFIDSSKNIYTCSSDKTVKKLTNTWGKVKIAYYA